MSPQIMKLGSEYYNLFNTTQQINPLEESHECKDPVFFIIASRMCDRSFSR